MDGIGGRGGILGRFVFTFRLGTLRWFHHKSAVDCGFAAISISHVTLRLMNYLSGAIIRYL
jgi:hypothetical protein